MDYRKLLIDLPGVKNAWLRPASLSYYANTKEGKLSREQKNLPGEIEVKLGGLYDVVIDFMDDRNTEVEKATVIDLVKETLLANRDLCEDFVSFTGVDSQQFLLCCELEVAPDADVAALEAEILSQVQEYMAPSVPNYTLSEMLQRKHPDGTAFTVDEIFDGPTLGCGFIDDDELARADLSTEIHLSDVIRVIMGIPGVRAVKEIIINPEGTKIENKWIIPIESGQKALLSREKSRLVFYKGNMPVAPKTEEVDAKLTLLAAAARAKTETVAQPAFDLPIPLGRYRQLAKYYSFQNHFPVLYGLSEQGLSGTQGGERKALAFQLKAYLLFFDQIMANYFAQLSRVKDLLSANPGLGQTYFCQVVDSFNDSEKIYQADPAPLTSLTAIAEEKETFANRRSRFLDHLIARFGEQFTDYVHTMASAFASTPDSLIRVRCAFLQNYPAISCDRALAYNYSLQQPTDLWDSANVSGLERRLASLLGLPNFNRRNLKDVAFDTYAEIDSTPDDEFRWRIYERVTSGVVLSSSTKYVTPEQAREEMRTAITLAMVPEGYQRKTTTSGKHYFNIVDATGEVVGRRIEYFDTAEEMEQAIGEVMEYLRTNYSDEGMYLIEMILLRPDEEDDDSLLLPICPDPNCVDCAEEDPYSYRIHVILPAYGSRFANMDFRRFCEEVIRAETPAHILPRVCWVSQDDMGSLEKHYRDWIYLKADADGSDRAAKMRAFIDVLFAVRNVYPPQQLHECDSPENEEKFLLGQTALGTMKEQPDPS